MKKPRAPIAQSNGVLVTVASDGNGAHLWTAGNGDFDVQGDFKGFVKSLEVCQ